jgi:hypothetical protein
MTPSICFYPYGMIRSRVLLNPDLLLGTLAAISTDPGQKHEKHERMAGVTTSKLSQTKAPAAPKPKAPKLGLTILWPSHV